MKRQIGWVALAAITVAFCAPASAEEPAASELEVNDDDARRRIETWPQNKRTAAEGLIDKYGAPDEITSDRLSWADRDNWSHVTLHREGKTENFPTTHENFIEHTVRYDVPREKAGELIKFHPSLVVDQQEGTLSARSDSVEANILALNLADEIVQGKRTVNSARNAMREELRKEMAGKDSRYTEGLMFTVPEREPMTEEEEEE